MAEMAHAADMQHGHGGEHDGSHASAKFYTIVGIILTVVTAIEVAIFYVPALSRVLVPTLLVLSAGKFIGVVAYYMHLKFDNGLFTFLFVIGLALGLFEVGALMTLSHLNPRMVQPPSPVRMMVPVMTLETMSPEEIDAITSGLPAEPAAATIAAGAERYPRATCVGCHGTDGTGVVNMGPDLTDPTWLHTDGSYPNIVATILRGVPNAIELNNVMQPRGGMSTLTDDQVLELAAYIYSLSH